MGAKQERQIEQYVRNQEVYFAEREKGYKKEIEDLKSDVTFYKSLSTVLGVCGLCLVEVILVSLF